MRTSTREVQAVFERLCKAADVEPLGLPGGTPIYVSDEHGIRSNRGWSLDNNPVYGGWVIAGHSGSGTGEDRPFGDRRLPPGEFVSHMHFAVKAIANIMQMAF